MKANFAFFTLLTFFWVLGTTGQEIKKDLVPDVFLEEAPQEQIYVHHNSSVIFPGEYFLYKVYNRNSTTGELSSLSKIAYVELLGETGNVVFRQKVKLENGSGSADYFIPTSVPSGNYKLLAYTNWMRNLENNFFEANIILINPYQSLRRDLLEEQSDSNFESTLSRDLKATDNSSSTLLTIALNKRSSGNREKVVITTNPGSTGVLKGKYSLSVRKKESLSGSPTKTAVSATSNYINSSDRNNGTLRLPELRGQMVSGRLVSAEGGSAENKVVALSIPSEEGFARLSTTNKEGQFFFNVESDLRDGDAVLEVVGPGSNEYDIELETNKGLDPSNLNFSEFKLTPAMKDVILQRSIYNQIENAFFAVKPDTLVPPGNDLPLPEGIVEKYELDDYTRFKSVPETFVEIVKSAWVRKNPAGEVVFQVRGLMNHVEMGLLPLVMIDGILVQDHSIPAGMDARRFKSIRIIRDKIYLGAGSFQGAVLFETINRDFFNEYSAPNVKKVELFTPEIPKRYFQQVYTDENRNNRIPDFRYQLLWEPELLLPTEGGEIEFFTSDVDGDFEVVLEGFTGDGKPVSIREQFIVE